MAGHGSMVRVPYCAAMASPPTTSVRGTRGAVASADQAATIAGIRMLAAGGNAVDAAIATNAVMAVVGPHLCGIGGDLFALVVDARTAWSR